MDYQCGTAPFGQCSGSVNDCASTQRGVSIDSSSNVLYYASVCRSISDNSNNITIKKVSVEGGVPSNVFSELESRGPDNIDKVFTVVNGVLYFDRIERQPGSNLSSFNLKSSQKATVQTGPGFFEGQLEILNGASYTCQLDYGSVNSYSIVRYPGVVGQTSPTNGKKIYVIGSSQCGPVRRGTGSNLIFTVYTYKATQSQQVVQYTTTFYKGTVTGSISLPSPFFSVSDQVSDFDIDSTGNIIVYGTQYGLFKRDGQVTTTISTESITGVTIYNKKIYYNNGFTIRSVTLDGKTTQNLIQQQTGTCSCRSGFYGDNCQSCDGQIQWEGGFPSCVPVNKEGVPTTCAYDYQCGNVPYTICSLNSCTCRENFSGKHCDECTGDKSITFNNGIPSCQ